MRSQVLLVSLALLSSACASTRMTSMVAPDAANTAYRRILVLAAYDDLEMMQAAELRMQAVGSASARNRAGALVCDPVCRAPGEMSEFIPAHTILFPGREYSAEELRAILHEHRIDATLILSPTAAGVSESYVPPTLVTSCSRWGSTTSCTSRPVGGGTIRRPWATYAARLYDARTAATVWIATSRTNGSMMSDASSLIASMAQETLNKLLADKKIL